MNSPRAVLAKREAIVIIGYGDGVGFLTLLSFNKCELRF